MSFLTEEFDDSFEYKGKEFNVDMAYDNILLLFEMFNDDMIHDTIKMDIAVEMLVIEYEELQISDMHELSDLFYFLMKEFVGIDLKGDKEESEETQAKDMQGEIEKPKEFMNYEKDAEYIYASFLFDYGIDLFEERGKMHWNKFNSLLINLSDESKLKKVISYRTAKIPTGKHANSEQAEHIRKMKRIYALDRGKKQSPEEMNKAFDSVGNALKEMAMKKNKVKGR